MDKRKINRIKPCDIPTLNEYASASLYYRRLLEYLNENKISKSTISFELLCSLVGAHESEDKSAEKLIESLPVPEWRKNTVQVPIGILRPLIEAWMEFKDKNDAYTFAQALGIDGKNQGKSNTAKKLRTLNRNVGLFNKVIIERQMAPDKSLAEIYEDVAQIEKLSADTVKKAYQENIRRFEHVISGLGKNF